MKILLPTIFFSLLLLIPDQTAHAQKVRSIKIDPRSEGRTFLGIGGLSAGASSRLLLDYPEPQRSHILDLLFKPKFGASLQILKTEIGGDVNSTDGTEPSHARTIEEFLHPRPQYFQRGYEWWLMKEAKKRNPEVYLDCLEWGAPAWIGHGTFYSQDNINYIISFVKGAKKYYGLTIDYTGIRNERMYNVNYIKALRKSLNENDLSHVKIIAADLCCGEQWLIAGDILQDKDLLNSISIFGDHYPERSPYQNKYQSNEQLKETGKPITNSEGGPWKGTWEGFRDLVKMYNRDYIIGKMTSQITWSLISSYYDNLSLPGSGLMKANTPWSGYFKIQPAIWAAAHTTQFTMPGWKYLDDACGFLMDSLGSYVTLVSPGSPHDYSIIIETMDASNKQEVAFELAGGLSRHDISVWKSTYQKESFVQQKNITPYNGRFSITLEPKSVYSLTTTEGQHKGSYTPSEDKPFPLPYHTDFEEGDPGQLPKYFSDQGGAFELHNRSDGKGECLQQMVTKQGIEWDSGKTYIETVIGDTAWTDYEVSVDLNVTEDTGSAKILGRVMDVHRAHEPPEGYWFEIDTGGKWALYAGSETIKSGSYRLAPFQWHHLKLKLKGNIISVFIDARKVIAVENNKYNHGMAGLGSGFNLVQFDNFAIKK